MTAPADRRPTLWLHLVGALAVPGCLAAGIFEWHRAQAGNDLSWGYTVEWPVIAAYGTYLWVRLVRERRGTARRSAAPGAGLAAPVGSGADGGAAPEDPELDAWREYLAHLHAAQPPGGPPAPRPRRDG